MQRDGLTHKSLIDKPELRRDCIRYLDAYRVLSSSRMWSQAGPQPLQISEVMALLVHGLGIEETSTRMKYVRLIKKMDRVELKYLHAKASNASKAAKK